MIWSVECVVLSAESYPLKLLVEIEALKLSAKAKQIIDKNVKVIRWSLSSWNKRWKLSVDDKSNFESYPLIFQEKNKRWSLCVKVGVAFLLME
jgi:hypothetical protein